jgi:hypothetical protein
MKIKKSHLNQLIQEEILKIKTKNLLNESHVDGEDFTKYVVSVVNNSNDLLNEEFISNITSQIESLKG